MGILARIMGTERQDAAWVQPVAITRSTATSTDTAQTAPWLFNALGGFGSNTGVPVTSYTALSVAAVYACVRCLSEDLAKLPLVVRRKLPGGGWRTDHLHPLNLLLREPNRWHTAYDFKSYLIASVCLRGNGYAVIVRDEAGRPRSLIPVSPQQVGVFLSPEGWVFYSVHHPLLGDGLIVHQDDMLHIRGMSLDGYTGISPIAAGQDVIGLALAAQQHGATLFRQGAQLGGVLTFPNKLSAEAAQRIAQSWRDVHSGVQNAHKTAVLEEGGKFEKASMTSEDAQLLATRGYQALQIASMYRVPPEKIGERPQTGSLESSNLEYVSSGLMPIGKQIEEKFERGLLFRSERETLDLKFDYDALLRADTATRFTTYQTGLSNGILSVNEVREREGLPPIEGGDTYRVPLNTGAIGAVDPGSVAAVTAPPPAAG